MRLRLILVASAVLAAAGCAGTLRTVSHQFPQPATAARVILQDAGAAGPVLVEARGSPFAGDVAAAFAAGASRSVPGLGTIFTADRAAAARPETRLVVQFYPGDQLTAGQVCALPPPPTEQRSPDQLVAFTVFCQGPRPVLAAMQWAPLPDNANSPVIREMAEQAMLRMFITDNDTHTPSNWWPD